MKWAFLDKETPDEAQYDMTTFGGRFRHFKALCNPATLLLKNNDVLGMLKESRELQAQGKNPETNNLYNIAAVIHPDTHKPIFHPFRIAGFVPFNAPMLVGLLMPNPSAFATFFWQWANQTHNAAVNYCNRPITDKPTPDSELYKFKGYTLPRNLVNGYGAAVTTALTLAYSMKAVTRAVVPHVSASVSSVLKESIPFVSVCTASLLNFYLMRRHELEEGIVVTDDAGAPLGVSKIAAKKALTLTGSTRPALTSCLLLGPPIIYRIMGSSPCLKRILSVQGPIVPRLLIQATVCSTLFFFSLPASLALFPQYVKMPTKDLEADLAASIKQDTVTFNRGL